MAEGASLSTAYTPRATSTSARERRKACGGGVFGNAGVEHSERFGVECPGLERHRTNDARLRSDALHVGSAAQSDENIVRDAAEVGTAEGIEGLSEALPNPHPQRLQVDQAAQLFRRLGETRCAAKLNRQLRSQRGISGEARGAGPQRLDAAIELAELVRTHARQLEVNRDEPWIVDL